MRIGYRSYTPDREDLYAGERCHGCSIQLKGEPPDVPCPECGSWLRRLPRLKGQVASAVVDARQRPAEDDPADGA